MRISKHSGTDHTVLPCLHYMFTLHVYQFYITSCLSFLRKRSPDGATPNKGSRHPIVVY